MTSQVELQIHFCTGQAVVLNTREHRRIQSPSPANRTTWARASLLVATRAQVTARHMPSAPARNLLLVEQPSTNLQDPDSGQPNPGESANRSSEINGSSTAAKYCRTSEQAAAYCKRKKQKKLRPTCGAAIREREAAKAEYPQLTAATSGVRPTQVCFSQQALRQAMRTQRASSGRKLFSSKYFICSDYAYTTAHAYNGFRGGVQELEWNL